MDEYTAWLTLAHAPGIHIGSIGPLIQQVGTPAAIIEASPATLRASGAPNSLIAALQTPSDERLEASLRWLAADNHHFLPWNSPSYPPLLAELADAPVGVFVRGDPGILGLPQLAIVGSRNPTPTGRENAHRFAGHLTRCGLTITSGLALGIDTAGHHGALEAGGSTIAVCGTGLDVAYPRSNVRLAEAIASQGALVSEFPLSTPALKANFPRRNRLISGLSLGTLVVEAAVQSGSLITARLAAEQGREVFALPGSIHNPLAHGCHRLIRQGAKLVETADDIFVELRGITGALVEKCTPAAARRVSGDSRRTLDKGYEILLDALGFEPAGVDSLVARTRLGADEVASMLLILELENRIESYPGGLYVRRP